MNNRTAKQRALSVCQTLLVKLIGEVSVYETNGLGRVLKLIYRNRYLYFLTIASYFITAIFEGGSIIFFSGAVAVLTNSQTGNSAVIINLLPSNIVEKLQSFGVNKQFIVLISIGIAAQFFRSAVILCGLLCKTYLVTEMRRQVGRQATLHFMSVSYETLTSYPRGRVAAMVEQTIVLPRVVNQSSRIIEVVILLIGYGLIIFITSVYAGLVTIFWIFGIWILMNRVAAKLRGFAQKETDAELFRWRSIYEYLNAGRMLRIFNYTESAGEIINKARDVQLSRQRKGSILLGSVNPIVEAGMIVLVGVGLVGVAYLVDGVTTHISLVFILVVVMFRAKPHILALNQARLKLVRLLPLLGYVEEFLSMEGKKLGRGRGGVVVNGVGKGIRFNNVDFRYPEASENALTKVTFEIKKNQTVALVGASGSGKSTIADLLVGLYEPTEGEIEIDGHKLSELDLYEWREQLGVVDQEALLLNVSIRDNIAFAKHDASFKEIEDAARVAAADDFIRQTTNQYDTIIGDQGLKLSGGQRQRIALARALVRNPSFMILDEAMSALDSESERIIQRSIEAMHGSRTILVIAHRLSTIRLADWIVVLDQGTVAEQGGRNELLEANGLFAHYSRIQEAEPSNKLAPDDV